MSSHKNTEKLNSTYIIKEDGAGNRRKEGSADNVAGGDEVIPTKENAQKGTGAERPCQRKSIRSA